MATLYWDPDGIPGNNNVATGAGLGGSGMWSNAPIACWFNPATGKNVAWTNAAGDVAVFTGPPQIPDNPIVASGTVNVSGSVSCAEAWFQSNFYSLQSEAAQPGSISLPASGTSISVSTGMGATIDVPITGSGTLSKGGEGLLVLTANETYTGATKVLAGTLDVRGNLASHVTASGGTVAGLVFFDPDLAAAVRETLGMSVDTVLTPSKVAGLSALTVDSNKISDLTGLNPANTPNLAALSLLPGDFSATPAGLTSLAPLAGLAKLKTLAIQHVGLKDAVLETLPALPALDTLDVRFNAIGVVPTSVAVLPGLSTLLVHGNPSLTDRPRDGLLSLKGRPVDVDVAADGPEMATTVADLAASLYFLPQKMLEYVTNTVAFQPYVGLMKGPLATLQTRAGNDWDTNALLAGLFNAAGIETRFVSGSIKVTEKQVMDYVGARDVTAAANILSKAGIAGGIGTLTHAWMEASVRLPGAAAEAWLPLDASWKFRDFRPGVAGILENVPFSAVETDYLTNPSWQTKTTAEYYEAKVATWLAANRPGVTTADVAYDGPIRQQSFSKLPEGLPYKATASAPVTAPTKIPKYSVEISLSNGATPLFITTLSLDDIATKRLTIDPQLTAAGTLAQPALRIDGVTAAVAASTVPATNEVSLTISITSPVASQKYSRTFSRVADRFIAIGLDANQFTDAVLVEKRAVANAEQLNMANGSAVDNEKAVGGILDLAIASYFNASDADEAWIAGLTGAVAQRSIVALGIATSGPALSTTATPNLQFPYLPADMGIDVPANVGGAISIDSSTPSLDPTRDTLIGYNNSALEGLTLEELTNFDSISTVRAFQVVAATTQGINGLVEINSITVLSIDNLLPSPGVRPEIRAKIAEAVNEGLPGVDDYAGVTFKVLVPKTEVSLGGTTQDEQWKGIGYTLTCVVKANPDDPRNGKTVGYIINGSVNGGPLTSYGGYTSKYSPPISIAEPAVQVNNQNNYLGDPVNIANGNVYSEQTDVEIPNLGVPLAFRRHFDSVNTTSAVGSPGDWSDRGMGEGWSFTYSDQLKVGTDDTVTWFTDQGLRLEFAKTTTGYTNPTGMFGTLAGAKSTGFTWTDVDGKQTTFGAAVGTGVNAVYPLISIKDRFGNGIKVQVESGTKRLSTVSDLKDASRWLSFSYAADGIHISSIKDFTGRTWSYGYSGSRLDSVTAPVPAPGAAAPIVRYTYYPDAARLGLLQSLTDPLGNVTSWEYYANRR